MMNDQLGIIGWGDELGTHQQGREVRETLSSSSQGHQMMTGLTQFECPRN